MRPEDGAFLTRPFLIIHKQQCQLTLVIIPLGAQSSIPFPVHPGDPFYGLIMIPELDIASLDVSPFLKHSTALIVCF